MLLGFAKSPARAHAKRLSSGAKSASSSSFPVDEARSEFCKSGREDAGLYFIVVVFNKKTFLASCQEFPGHREPRIVSGLSALV